MGDGGGVASVPHEIDEYRVLRPLGNISSGRTYLAHDQVLDRAVVVTFLGNGEPAAVQLAAARALSRMTHPCLARVHRIREGTTPYLVSDFVRGRKLEAMDAPLPLAETVVMGRALAGALVELHRASVTHGDVRSPRIVVTDEGPVLFGLERARAAAGEASCREDVRMLVAVLEALAQQPLGLAGLQTADQLVFALERHVAGGDEPALENPYRGLRSYQAADRNLFFGRTTEVAELLARLRNEPWLLVAGRSGVGKSSLVRAGVAPAVAEGALGERPIWDVVTVTPGPRPLAGFAAALAPFLDREAGELEQASRLQPAVPARLARARTGPGLLLVVDQLEEAVTLATPAERDAFLAVLARFEALSPGLRTVMTLRSDFLGQISTQGILGRDLLRAATLIGPMRPEGLREAIVGPAMARGVEFENEAMVSTLVSESRGKEGALPLLSFALAELWHARNEARHMIPAEALHRVGGVAGALARHGDLVLAALPAEERLQARRILLQLVTAHETRAKHTVEDLLADGGRAAKNALEALIAGRLVIAGETCELAHEALITAWPRLRGWLDEESGARAELSRLEAAARDWSELGKPADGLFSRGQLERLPDEDALSRASPPARELLERSRAAVRRGRRRRIALWAGLPAVLLASSALVWGLFAWHERNQIASAVAGKLGEARAALADAERLEIEVEAGRKDAFARYDADDMDGGEAGWLQVLALERRETDRLGEASRAIDLARARDPRSPESRALAAALFYRWFLVAERQRDDELARELRSRLAQVDDGSFARLLDAPARLRVTTAPAGAQAVIHHIQMGDRYVPDEGHSIAQGSSLELAPGSYLLEARAPGRYPSRYPVFLTRGQDERVEIALPLAAAVPDGFVYVPAGRVLFGGAEAEATRRFYNAQPRHEVWVDAFLIAQGEVTFGDYLAFLDSLPPLERDERLPRSDMLKLATGRDGAQVLTLNGATARRGELLCRPRRSVHRCQDWSQLPVSGISWSDAVAYARWLAAKTNNRLHFRLCAEREWERAARGADGRRYVSGDGIRSDDFNTSSAWASDVELVGPAEVGAYPLDRSIFGVKDLAGNVGEYVGDTIDGRRVMRGGNWGNDTIFADVAGRFINPDERNLASGFRVCSDAPQ